MTGCGIWLAFGVQNILRTLQRALHSSAFLLFFWILHLFVCRAAALFSWKKDKELQRGKPSLWNILFLLNGKLVGLLWYIDRPPQITFDLLISVTGIKTHLDTKKKQKNMHFRRSHTQLHTVYVVKIFLLAMLSVKGRVVLNFNETLRHQHVW